MQERIICVIFSFIFVDRIRAAAPQRDENVFLSLYPLRISVTPVFSVVKCFSIFEGG
jgi:hypothetical protein